MAENADNALMLEILKEIRKEQRDRRTLLLQTTAAVRHLREYSEEKFIAIKRGFLDIEERMKAHKDDVELMLKSELLGVLTHFQNKIEIYVDQRLAGRAE
jgi:hypothetical protein